LSQRAAQELDEYLLSPEKGCFSIDQLMELAGLTVAQIIYETYPLALYEKVLICCGPGNNGGDGLVTARHLAHMGYSINLYYPVEPKKEIYSVSVFRAICFEGFLRDMRNV
jgi:NAD(P)H-hydrate epimerase